MFSIGSDQPLHITRFIPFHVWPALLPPVSFCSPVASDPQASQANAFSNLSNHLNLTPEKSLRLLFPVYTAFTSHVHQTTLRSGSGGNPNTVMISSKIDLQQVTSSFRL